MDLIEYLNQKKVPFRRHGEDHHVSREGWVNLQCPWCGSFAYHLGVHTESGACNCWRCGSRNFADALSLITGDSPGLIFRSVKWKFRGPKEESVTPRKFVPPPYVDDMYEAHINYLIGRGFDPDEVSEVWGVRGIGISDRLAWRLYIPIHDSRGREVSWTTRAIADNVRPRYLSASHEEEAVNHKSILYGAHLAKNVVVVVEGPIDAWAIGPGAVATCGTGFSTPQLADLGKYPYRVVCFDSDARAQQRALVLCESLSVLPGQTDNVVLETGSDPADCEPEELQELRQKYLPDS